MNQPDALSQPVQFAKGVGPERATLLEKLGVKTIEDLLYLAPRRHHDLRDVTPINRLRPKQVASIRGRLEYVKERCTRAGQPFIEAVFGDGSGFVTVLWFNRPDMNDRLRLDTDYRLTGKAESPEGRWKMANPQLAIDADASVENPGLIPVYPMTEGLSNDYLRLVIRSALERHARSVPELLPRRALAARQWPSVEQALWNLHFPASPPDVPKAKKRLIYDELLVLQMALALKRAGQAIRAGVSLATRPEVDARIRRLYPYPLTATQERVIDELRGDLVSPIAMNRLLQGDVGSGKTAIAIYAMLAAVANGYQTALLAPTEILAQQHYRTFDTFLKDSRVRRTILTGSLTTGERHAVLARLHEGAVDLVVGTHSLIQPSVQFAKLGLVVVDEQHKFGVKQRGEFQKRNPVPNMLVMTATPIPRSLSMTWFGDLDLSTLDEKPPGRKETLTYLLVSDERNKAYDFLRKATAAGERGLVVCPRIGQKLAEQAIESDNATEDDENDVQSVHRLHGELLATSFAGDKMAMIHGKLPDAEKNRIIDRFRAGDLKVLVSTVVVEVGLDIPDANIVVIENAERFGLSQLHQIRGRVGRGGGRGVCFLLTASKDPAVWERLKQFAETNDGFKLAELDAKYRGIGDLIGTRQSGFFALRMADILRDSRLLAIARRDAQNILARDPALRLPEWRNLRQQVIAKYGKLLDLAMVG